MCCLIPVAESEIRVAIPTFPTFMNRSPLVSVLTPTLNRRRFIPAFLRYVRRQDYDGPLEILVADDGAEDLTDLLRTDPRVRYLRLAGRIPLGHKRNLLATEARGEFLVHMDDDDFYPSNRVSHAVKRLAQAACPLALASEHYFYQAALDRIFVSGPFGANHGVASTMAYHRSYLASHRFDDDAMAQEEHLFTDGFSAPAVQLDPRSTVLGIIHSTNTWDKSKTVMREVPLRLKDFVRNIDDRRFYRNLLSKSEKALSLAQA